MPPQLKLSELYKIQDNKKTHKFNSFDRILEICHNKIRNTARIGGMTIFYEIPGMMLGYPLYDVNECCQYIVKSLRKTGLLVQILPPPHVGVIYISWNPAELKAAPPAQLALPAPAAPMASAPAHVNKKKKLSLFL